MQIRGLHRQGDSDSDGDKPVSYSGNVFANGGKTLGGAIADVLGLDDTVGISDAEARAILEGRAAEQAVGNDPDSMESLEWYEFDPNTGQKWKPEAGSDAATGADAGDGLRENQPSEWIKVLSHVNPNVKPELWSKLIFFAKSLGRPLTMTSGVGQRKIKNSQHPLGNAADIVWGVSSVQGRIDMIQKACDAGFTGIGCYNRNAQGKNDFIHVDIRLGPKQSWGPTGSYTSQYEQYKPVLRANGFPNY